MSINGSTPPLLGFAMWSGFRAGFVATTYGLASWILAVAAALAFERPATTMVQTIGRLPAPLGATIGFVVTIVVAQALFSAAGYVAIRPIVGLSGEAL